jgi:hypothetical protein
VRPSGRAAFTIAKLGVLRVEAEQEVRVFALDGVTQGPKVQLPCGALLFDHVAFLLLSVALFRGLCFVS